MVITILIVAVLASSLGALPVACRDGSTLRHNLQARRHADTWNVPRRRSAENYEAALKGRDYWERLVGTPSRLALKTVKEGVLPTSKYSMADFSVHPFQAWLRQYDLLLKSSNATAAAAATTAAPPSAIPPPPLSFICGVWYSPQYKFIFIRNRKTASSTFITAVKKFMLERGLCQVNKTPGAAHPHNCVMRMEPEVLAREGHDLDAMWREYTVITSTRNPWARAASGYQFTFDKWHRQDGACVQPTFLEFCRDPFIMGKLSNLFGCVAGQREGVGTRNEGQWNFDFCHVEPAAACMVDDAGKLVVDFVIRYERLDDDMQAALELINARRPAGLPAIEAPRAVKWRNKGTTTQQRDVNSTDEAAFVYADKYRRCGAPCVEPLADFYVPDLELFGWDRPGPAPPVPPEVEAAGR